MSHKSIENNLYFKVKRGIKSEPVCILNFRQNGLKGIRVIKYHFNKFRCSLCKIIKARKSGPQFYN